MGLKDSIKDQAKEQIKNKVKAIIKKVMLKYVIPVVGGFILVACAFFIITGAIGEAVSKVKETVSSVFSSIFDNKEDYPTVTISDDVIKEIKKELEKEAVDIDETYLTDNLLKQSLSAYYATQYPYIDGADYTDDTVKGCIYLKRGNSSDYMTYISYDSFKSKIGEGKTANDVSYIKQHFSMDDDENIVVATWSENTEVTECIEDGYQQQGTHAGGYSISEYKIDQKTLTAQYAMPYKLPIILANLYSNEGFGMAVANLALDSKIELTVLDSTTKTNTVSKEYYKMNYKTSGTYSWRHFESDSLTTENFQDIEWLDDYTTEDKVYKIKTQTSEENSITIKATLLDTWVIKGSVDQIIEKTDSSSDSNTTTMENNPATYTTDSNIKITEEQRAAIIKQIVDTKDRRNNR